MRLASLHVDGFGIFHNLDISDLSPGLNVFLGENESGKTTLLAFLRVILFAFPRDSGGKTPTHLWQVGAMAVI